MKHIELLNTRQAQTIPFIAALIPYQAKTNSLFPCRKALKKQGSVKILLKAAGRNNKVKPLRRQAYAQ